LAIRDISVEDAVTTYEWANDELVRKNSFSSQPITFKTHQQWWLSKTKDKNAIYYICEIKKNPAGIVRFDKDKTSQSFTIAITVAPSYRGKGLSDKFLRIACKEFFKKNNSSVNAYIKEDNISSIKAF